MALKTSVLYYISISNSAQIPSQCLAAHRIMHLWNKTHNTAPVVNSVSPLIVMSVIVSCFHSVVLHMQLTLEEAVMYTDAIV